MGKLRFLLALWLAKLSVPALKITRHNGTDFPGSLALKLCPDFLRYVGKPGTIIAVTGTNGKTTVSNLLTDILEADGKKVLSNRSGSNITSGISTALLRGCDLLGRAKSYDMAVLEVDERASVRIFPYVKPDYAVVTNLTRDSIMRNAHPGYIADILTRSIPQTATMILNADDLITCGVAPENRRVYFGVDRLPGDTTRCENLIDDLRICPKCSGKLTYVYRRYHHIGKCVCPDCGFRSPESDYLATDVDMEKGTMALREGGEEHPYRLISDSVPNLYNMVTVIAVLRQLGYSHEAISGLHEPCGGGGHPAHGGAGGEREAGAADVQGEERTGRVPNLPVYRPAARHQGAAVDDELSGGRPPLVGEHLLDLRCGLRVSPQRQRGAAGVYRRTVPGLQAAGC